MMTLDPRTPSAAQVDLLLDEWKKDAIMDKLEPANELRKIGSLHAKYLTIISSHRRAFQEGERKYAKLRRIKYEYYSGRLDLDTLTKYGWPPFPFTLKADMATYMDADSDILNAKQVLGVHAEIVECAQSIIKELNNRTWQLKEVCGWEKFISGAH